ncbi:hypothetical protein FF125_07860 [Aureibaculum algae]|uniref:Uncharacterized protein n=1 Tax=Aureibaculum algae TaxID=2584122 RepID=A0A5B7TQ23_9FLAO|nr:hypothetical protein [Aureibaculum algae]QCX38350.1 hypothetical protein FF125_07860 [Aureibaculum algae]
MKTIRKITLLFALIMAGTSYSQESSKNKEESKINKEIDKTSNEVKRTSETVNSATDSITSTIKQTKKSVKDLKTAIFGERKSKKKKEKTKTNKDLIIIQIANIAYSNSNLKELQNSLSKIKGVKNVSKSYTNGNAIINIATKENADFLWQNISERLNKVFIVNEMNEKNILLDYKESASN